MYWDNYKHLFLGKKDMQSLCKVMSLGHCILFTPNDGKID